MTDLTATSSSSPPGLDLFLLSLRYKQGQLSSLEANNPLLLDDPDSCYVVYTGSVDVFAVQLRSGEQVAPRRHLLRVEDGNLLFGFALEAQAGIGLLATGVPGTNILKLQRDRLMQLAAELENSEIVGAMLDRWLADLQRATARELGPKNALELQSGQTVKLNASQAAISKNDVLWVTRLSGGVRWSDRDDVKLPDGSPIPLAPAGWLDATEASELAAVDTVTWLAHDHSWTALSAFHTLALQLIALNDRAADASERARLVHKSAAQQAVVGHALGRIAALLNPKAATPLSALDGETGDPLLAACRLVGNALGVQIVAPDDSSPAGFLSPLHRIAKASGIRVRQVSFKGDWWKIENGPLLASVAATNRPVALLPSGPGRYTLNDPVEQRSVPLTQQLAATLVPNGYMFYRALPRHSLNVWDLLRFSFRDNRRDLAMVVALGIAGGLLSMVGPIATGIVFDRVLPENNRGQLLMVGVVLLVIAVSTVLFQITRSIAMLRVETKSTGALQAAVWDRLLGLPVPFFRKYSAGDLGVRVMGINQIRQTLSGPVLTSILSGIFSVFNIALLFYYDARLGAIATALVLLAVLVTTAVGYVQVRQQRALSELEGRIQGLVLQFLNGIGKFKVAGAQYHAFASWADLFSEQRRLSYRLRRTSNGLSVFNATYPIITSLAIFASVALTINSGMSTGHFLAFNAAFSQLLFAALQLSSAFIAVLAIIPTYERAKPILETLPEVSRNKAEPGVLAGAIAVSHVSFRYTSDGPLVLKDVSIEVKPGEFVALAGPSGSGKSSLLRLLLGFDVPESGIVYYDGQDLQSLDIESVRRQIGVVLQSGRLMPGLLLQNIIGTSLLTVDDAWEAARMAGLDSDIRAMPMGMFTMVSEGAGTLSGGQRQRLMIAKAVVNKPRIIFFDEATSALDNRTQELVSRSLEGLQATRVVIAHRLSTIVNAHKIYVMEGGKVVQAGTYSELIGQPGLFADLARRQLE